LRRGIVCVERALAESEAEAMAEGRP
jgi:hypothetical protein